MNNRRNKVKKLVDSSSLENYAVFLLSRKDYSVKDLTIKLINRCDNQSLIDSCISKMQDYNYLCDKRFTENYVRSCKEYKGYGPVKIRHNLKSKGINSTLISSNLCDEDEYWYQRAIEIRTRRFGTVPAKGKDREKQSRFLLGRGFTFSQINNSFNNDQYE